MNELPPPSRQRAALARSIAHVYAAEPHVAAVILGGSVARGWADRWSDVELGVFWSAPPSESARTEVAIRAGAAHRRVYPEPTPLGAVEEDYEVSQVKVDVTHLTVEATDRVLGDVVERHDPTLIKQVLVAAIHHGVPLHGAPLLRRWRAETD